jgi:hypothetical protein
MMWHEVRETYADQWLVIEALDAHTQDRQRHLDCIAVVQLCPDGEAAMRPYRDFHRTYPERGFYYVHTARESLDIRERQGLSMGIRRFYGQPAD